MMNDNNNLIPNLELLAEIIETTEPAKPALALERPFFSKLSMNVARCQGSVVVRGFMDGSRSEPLEEDTPLQKVKIAIRDENATTIHGALERNAIMEHLTALYTHAYHIGASSLTGAEVMK